MPEKLKSRKWWLTFAVGVVILFARQLGLELDESQLWELIALATGYNLTQGYVDAKAVSK